MALAGLMRQATLGQTVAGGHISIGPNPTFFLRHHPRSWRVSTTLAQPTLLPDVTKHVISPGVNGCRTLGEHDEPQDAYENSVHRAEKRGFTYLSPIAPIPAACLPPGVPPGGYIRALDCRHPLTRVVGHYHTEAWNVPIATLPDEDQQFKFHLPTYELWLEWLVLSGQIAPPNERVIQTLRDRVRQHVERTRLLNVAPDIRDEFVRRKAEIAARYDAARAPTDLPASSAETETTDDPPDPKRSKRTST
jgi:hypothetical protein